MRDILEIFGLSRLLLKLDTAFGGLIFYCLGYLFSKNDVMSIFKNKNKNIVFITVFGILSYLSYTNGMINVCQLRYNNFCKFMFFALAGIIFVFLIAKNMEEVRFMSYIGKNSLIMFAPHSLVLYAYAGFLSLFANEQKFIMSNLSILESLVGTLLTLIVLSFCAKIVDRVKIKLRCLCS